MSANPAAGLQVKRRADRGGSKISGALAGTDHVLCHNVAAAVSEYACIDMLSAVVRVANDTGAELICNQSGE